MDGWVGGVGWQHYTLLPMLYAENGYNYYNWIPESNFLLWNTPGSDDAVTVALG